MSSGGSPRRAPRGRLLCALLLASFSAAAAAPSAPTAAAPARSPDRWKSLEVGSARGVPGKKVRGSLSILEAVDGAAFPIPIVLITGTKPGPVVWIHALSHGDEYGGARALQEIVRELDPAKMTGAIVAVMVANPPAFQGLGRVNPNIDDQIDLGNTWPGKSDGFATERLVHGFFSRIKADADYFVDLHSGGDRFRQHPFILYCQTGAVDEKRMDDLAMTFGVPTLWRDTVKVFAGDALTQVLNEGIPAFLVEVGGSQPLLEADIRVQADAVKSFLRGVGVLPGSPALRPSYLVVTNYQIVTNARGGFFEPGVSIGQRIRGGESIGVIRDVHGEVIETMRAPAQSEIVLGVGTYPAWPSGGWLFELGSGLYELKPNGPARR